MKYFFSLAAVLSIVLGDPGFVQLPLTAKHVNKTASSDRLMARSQGIPDTLQNSVVQYLTSISLGTPGQPQTVSIDTGSSDLWVYSPGDGAPTSYDPSQSSTSQFVNSGFQISYVDGTGASGDYYTDDSSMGGATVNFQFAVADMQDSRGSNGVFGIAQTQAEASQDGQYANYPVALKQQGLIESTAYSLYLDDVDASTGSLLFGGVDTSKYSGKLYTVPITSSQSFNVNFEVAGEACNGVLDAGTSFTYLPDDVASSLASQYNAQWGSSQNFGPGYYVDEPPSSGSVTYSFSGAKVTVDVSDLFIEAANGQYLFTIVPTSQSQGTVLLGDSFLRSAYVVYDLDNQQIGIAQADYNGRGSIRPITSRGIPGSQPAPDL